VEPGETMKVLLIDVNCKYSSTGKIVYDLYTELNSQGHTASIAYGRGPLVKELNVLKFGVDIETYFHAFLTRITGLTGFFSPVSTYRLIRFIKKFRPDVVHIHELHGYFVNIGTLVTYLKHEKIPTLWTYHCEFMYTGKCGYTEDCIKFTNQCGDCPLLSEYPKSLYFDFTSYMLRKKIQWLTGFDSLKIITPSRWLQRKLMMSKTNHIPSKVIPNGIDTSIFLPNTNSSIRQQLNISTEFIVLSVIADFKDARKGFDFIKPIAEQLDSKIYTWIVVGGDHFPYPMPNHVIHVKKVNSAKLLVEYYNIADVFVILSKYENLPTVCLEASACQCPVVGWNVGGTSEAIIGVASMLYEYGDMDIIEGIKVICNQKTVRNENELIQLNRKEISKIHIDEYLELSRLNR
jgi:glycosyltransferase involved in cell wall biosynthesis